MCRNIRTLANFAQGEKGTDLFSEKGTDLFSDSLKAAAPRLERQKKGTTEKGDGSIFRNPVESAGLSKIDLSPFLLLNNLGWLYWSSGREDEARRAFEDAIRRNPGNGRAWGNLGSLLAKKGDVEAAIRHLREATRLRPDRTDLVLELLELESQTPQAEA